ncbi:kinase-like domain-containing protein [Circinella umbellata]|nr:kinase-like domain-containing protein [Circinella umbellata]
MHNNHGSNDSRASTNTTHLSSSSSSYSSCTTSTTYIQRHASSSTTIFPHPALHNTSRFLPQNQAILTTYDDWRVILSNDIAAQVLVGVGGSCRGLVGKSVVDFIEPSYRDRFLDMVTKRREELSHLEDSMGGMVLICGNVLPIIKQDGSRSAASLWLKEKRNDAGSPVYIWIFEEGIIQYTDDSVHELYGYEPGELIGKSVDMLIPSLKQVQDITRLRFFGSRTKLGAQFPIVAKIHTANNDCFTLRITSIPMIAGLVTIRKDGTIEGCNTVFAGYMFGLSQEELVTKHIADLMPQIPALLDCLQRDDLLQHGIIINSLICRKLIADSDENYNNTNYSSTTTNKRLTHAPNGQVLPILLAIHRDKTPFEIQLQLKLVEGSNDVCALWITFDREATFSRAGHTSLISNPPLEIKQHDGLAAAAVVPSSPISPCTPRSRPSSRPPSTQVILPDYSAQTNATTIDDYTIVDTLGQGAYGLVKLAVKKNDPEQKKVVIKYVIKSRILVDCWTKDRKLGVIPVEIHILHTLRKIPHQNCSDMLDYFEDDDHYYVVMGLHGVGMDLFDYIELKNGMMDDEIREIFKQIAQAVCHLHDNKIVHRDIKDENVVLDQSGGVRLIDFGSAAYLKGRRYDTFVGTLDYAAPEILAGQTYEGPAQDIWALGILLYTLVYRENPFYDIDEILSHELRVPFVLSDGKFCAIPRNKKRREIISFWCKLYLLIYHYNYYL